MALFQFVLPRNKSSIRNVKEVGNKADKKENKHTKRDRKKENKRDYSRGSELLLSSRPPNPLVS